VILTLKGISQKGKNRINENGDKYKVEEVRGNKFLIRSVNGKDFRWIEKENDKNFEIVKRE